MFVPVLPAALPIPKLGFDREKMRALLKAFSWRAVAALDTMIVAWLVTGRIGLALSVMSVEFFTKISMYYAHERAWAKFR